MYADGPDLLEPGTNDINPADVQIYRDSAGRYVVVHPPRHDEPWFAAEWPTSREAVAAWTDQTMLVADDTSNTATLLALTPQPDGQMRVDPVPMPVDAARDAFGYGYGGGTPAVTYRAILRLVLKDSIAAALGQLTFDLDINKNGPVSQL